MPLPPLAEQRRIAALLREQMVAVERARAAAEAQLAAARELPGAYLREVFESEDAKEWAWKRLRDVCTVHPGQHVLEPDYNRLRIGIGLSIGRGLLILERKSAMKLAFPGIWEIVKSKPNKNSNH